MSKYPEAIADATYLPERRDGDVIYGQHLNAVQDEIIQIEKVLGVGKTAALGVPSLLQHNLEGGGFSTLVARLADMSLNLAAATAHINSSTSVHGVLGSVVGTTDTQTLTNKTLVDPILSGTVGADGVAVTGGITFSGDVNFTGSVIMTQPPSISDFTLSQHDHSSAAKGGAIPMPSVTGLQAAFTQVSPIGHRHTRSDIDGFTHDLDSHSGNLPKARVTGLGVAAGMDAPTVAGTQASAAQLARGDDPRMSDERRPARHADSHRTGGADPISPASIGAALAGHRHSTSEVDGFATALNDVKNAIYLSWIKGLQDAVADRLLITGTAANSSKINGHRITVSATAPGSPAVDDIWIKK